MQAPPWHERVWSEVVRRGLPPSYADRLLMELGDHAEELGEGSEQQLGSVEELAEAAVSLYRSSYFAGRHPLASFVFLPVVATIAGLVAHAVVVVTILEWFIGTLCCADHPMIIGFAIALVRLIGYVSPVAVVIGGWAVYRVCGRPLGWFLALALLVAGFASLIVTGFDPLLPHDRAEMYIHLIPPDDLHRVAQAVLTAIVGLSLAGLDRIRRPRSFAAA